MNPIREAAKILREYRARVSVDEFYQTLAQVPADELQLLAGDWRLQARPKQLRPADCKPIWLVLAGRGFGKTRTGAEAQLDRAEDLGPEFSSILCSKTYGDVLTTMIHDPDSGLLACARRRGYDLRVVLGGRARVEHPAGGVWHLCTAEKPDGPRGLQTTDWWGDEIAAWRNANDVLNQIILGWRRQTKHGLQGILTTTPKPNAITRRLLTDPVMASRVTVTKGHTSENWENLHEDTRSVLTEFYAGTRLGRQELEAELLESEGTMATQDMIHMHRTGQPPHLPRRVVALDPSITAKEDSDEAGIVVVGSDGQDIQHAYVIADLSIGEATFSKWARAAVHAYLEYDCEAIIAEINQGGTGIVEAIEVAAKDIGQKLGRRLEVPVKTVWAKQSKKARAEPVGQLYEKGRVHHIGHHPKLEKEITTWMPGMDSPNRLDALVYGVTHLLLGDLPTATIEGYLS